MLRNGIVVTVDDAKPRAAAVLIRGERMVAVGGEAELERVEIATISCTATRPDLNALAPNVFNRTVSDVDLPNVEKVDAVTALETRYAAQFGGLPGVTGTISFDANGNLNRG